MAKKVKKKAVKSRRPKKQRRKVTTKTVTTRTTTTTLGDAARAQAEHIDAVHVALEDGDCKRAAKELAEAKSHGPVKHEQLLVKQMKQACSTSDLGRFTSKAKKEKRARRRAARKLAKSDVGPLPTLPPLAYLVLYGAAAMALVKFAEKKTVAKVEALAGCAAAGNLGH